MPHFKAYRLTNTSIPRNHHSLYLETQPLHDSGQIYQVTGNIQTGMTYETKSSGKPEDDLTFLSKEFLGVVEVQDVSLVDEICRSVEVPGKQFEGAKRLEETRPLRRCQEWTEEVIGVLRARGVIY